MNLDRELVTIPGEKAVLARVALKDYLTSIIDKEWKELEHGHSSEETDRALGGLISAVHHLKDDGVNEKILSSVEAHTEAVSDLRDERIGVSEEHLSVIYWGIIFAFLLMLFVISFFSNPALPKRVGLAGKMIALGFSLVLLIQTDGVFSGDVAVQPTVYKNALAKMKIRTAASS